MAGGAFAVRHGGSELMSGAKARARRSASSRLETFSNPKVERDYTISIEIPEFTCLCPNTGQPDFAVLKLEYVPDKLCIELKSLKLYIWSFRDQGAFHEDVTNRILDDLCGLLNPRHLRLTARFNVRGGLHTTVVAEHGQPGWQGAAITKP
jgi:7-cyano-7-deazaguanine reductase